MRVLQSIVPRAVAVGGLGLVAAAFTAACDGESTFRFTIDAGQVDTRFSDVCSTYAQAYCGWEFVCPGRSSAWVNEDQCVERVKLTCELMSTDPGVHFDPSAVAACAARAVPCDALFPLLTSCLPPGDTPVGGACVWSASCATRVCIGSGGDGCGTCADCPDDCPGGACWTLPDGGSTCVFAGDGGDLCDAGPYGLCAPGTFCDPSGRCALDVPLGATCSPAYGAPLDLDAGVGPLCAVTAYCDPTGRCRPRAQLGESCGDGSTGPPCIGGRGYAVCDSTGRCSPAPTAGYGEACGLDVACAGGATCAYTDDTLARGVCVAPIPDGLGPCEPVSTSGVMACLFPAYCVNGVCTYLNDRACF